MSSTRWQHMRLWPPDFCAFGELFVIVFGRSRSTLNLLPRRSLGEGGSSRSLSNALLHFLQGNESGLSSVDLPLPLVENLLMPIRHRHLIFELRKRSPNSLHRSQLFLYRHLIQRQHSIHKPNHPVTPCIAQSFCLRASFINKRAMWRKRKQARWFAEFDVGPCPFHSLKFNNAFPQPQQPFRF